MPIPLLVLKPHRYDGRLWRKGQTLLARSADDALVLTTLGWAVRADVSSFQASEDARFVGGDGSNTSAIPVKRPRGRPRKNTYATRALVAESPSVEDEDDSQPIDIVADAPADPPNDSRWDVRKPTEE